MPCIAVHHRRPHPPAYDSLGRHRSLTPEYKARNDRIQDFVSYSHCQGLAPSSLHRFEIDHPDAIDIDGRSPRFIRRLVQVSMNAQSLYFKPLPAALSSPFGCC